jgi:hypothetical protein
MLFERKRRRKLRSNFRRSGSEFIILRIPMHENGQNGHFSVMAMTEKWPFWLYTVTGDNIFFSVGNQFFLFYNFNTTTHGAH